MIHEIPQQALGMETVFSNALTGCNLGAAVGGADFNPHNKSEAEIQRCVGACAHRFRVELPT